MSGSARYRVLALLTAAVLGASACGGSPTAAPPPDAAPSQGTATTRLAEIESELDGLGPEERRAKLIELAQAEGGEVSFYGGTNPEDVDPVLAAFEDQTDLTVNNYRASAATIFQRIQEESKAGFAGADVVIVGAAEFYALTDLGLLATFHTPIEEQIHEGGVEDTGIDVYRTIRIVTWNTNRLTPDRYPTTWEDVFENYPGEVVMDPTDWDWFATFTQVYLMGEKGMTEQEALDWWKSVAPNMVLVDGHTLGTQLVSTGEYSLAAVTYHHGLPPAGAPVAWEPPMWPVIVDGAKIMIMANAAHPASALLLSEFFLTDGQAILYEGGRSTSNVTAPSSWPPQYDDLTVNVDPALFTDEAEAQKWQALYEDVLAGAGQGS